MPRASLAATLRLRDRRHLLAGAAAFVAAILVALLGLYARAEGPPPAVPPAKGLVKIRVLGINDLHGHIEPPAPDLGGAAWLAARLDQATLPGRTIKVHAGDLVGASPLASSYFHDEPSIEVANSMGFDVGTLGNHEFDEGVDELERLLARRSPRRRGGVEARRRRPAREHLLPGVHRRALPLHLGERDRPRREAAAAALRDRRARRRARGLHRRDHPVRPALPPPSARGPRSASPTCRTR